MLDEWGLDRPDCRLRPRVGQAPLDTGLDVDHHEVTDDGERDDDGEEREPGHRQERIQASIPTRRRHGAAASPRTWSSESWACFSSSAFTASISIFK
jgi:hypothetical protein